MTRIGKLYHSTYFEEWSDKPVWCQADWIRINPQTKGITMNGRADATLNPAVRFFYTLLILFILIEDQGVRFGSAE